MFRRQAGGAGRQRSGGSGQEDDDRADGHVASHPLPARAIGHRSQDQRAGEGLLCQPRQQGPSGTVAGYTGEPGPGRSRPGKQRRPRPGASRVPDHDRGQFARRDPESSRRRPGCQAGVRSRAKAVRQPPGSVQARRPAPQRSGPGGSECDPGAQPVRTGAAPRRCAA